MKTKAAVLWEPNTKWEIEEIELDPPRHGEVLVKMVASGMCHSDEHIFVGDFPMDLPAVGGHEGAGIVEQVGEGVEGLEPGDHVVFSFVPSCGRCESCANGRQRLCDLGALMGAGLQISDGTSRHHARGRDLTLICMLGTFAHHTVVHETSCIKIDKSIPLEKACLFGCGVVTGWGSAAYAGNIKPGDDVVVVGVGGIGANALQGARMAGAARIHAIDPIEFKREAALTFGATHTYSSMEDAFEKIQSLTIGRMANTVILTMGLGKGEVLSEALALTAKSGRVVITNMYAADDVTASISLLDLMVMEKQVVGSLFGSANPRSDIPKLLDLYSRKLYDADSLVTRTYALDQINEGYDDMRSGRNIRGVLIYDH